MDDRENATYYAATQDPLLIFKSCGSSTKETNEELIDMMEDKDKEEMDAAMEDLNHRFKRCEFTAKDTSEELTRHAGRTQCKEGRAACG